METFVIFLHIFQGNFIAEGFGYMKSSNNSFVFYVLLLQECFQNKNANNPLA